MNINSSGAWALCGTLSCTQVSGSGEALFEGTLTDFSPRRVNLFYLGNRSVNTLTPTFDFSVQRGTVQDLVKYLFLELRDVSLELTAGGDTPADERDDVWSMAVYFRDRGGSGTTACHYRDTNDGGFAFRSGVHYKTSWTGEGFEIIGELSSKDGYKGVNIDGGDNPNGTTGKGGYNGADLN